MEVSNQLIKCQEPILDDQGTFHKGEYIFLFIDCRLQSMKFYPNEMPAYIIYCKFLNVEFLILNIFLYITNPRECVYCHLTVKELV